MSIIEDKLTGMVEQQSTTGINKHTIRPKASGIKRLGRPRGSFLSGRAVEQIHKRISADFGFNSPDTGGVLSGANFRFVIGIMIAAQRREMGLSQSDLAILYGSSRELISQIESGRTEVNSGDLPRLAEILAVPITNLFGLVENKKDREIIVHNAESAREQVKRAEPSMKMNDEEMILLLTRMQERVSCDLSEDEQLFLDTFRSCNSKKRIALLGLVPAIAKAIPD